MKAFTCLLKSFLFVEYTYKQLEFLAQVNQLLFLIASFASSTAPRRVVEADNITPSEVPEVHRLVIVVVFSCSIAAGCVGLCVRYLPT